MSGLQRIALGIVAVGALTVAVAPENKTADVAKAFGGLFQGSLRTAMTGR